MTAATAIARVSTSQLLRVRRTWGMLALALLPTLIFGIGQSGMSERSALQFFHDAPLATLFAIVTPVISLVAAAAALGEERAQHTLSFLTVRPLARWQIALAKMAAAWAAAFAVAGTGALVLGITFWLTQGGAEPLLPLLVAIALNVAVYAALFVPLGLLLRRAVLAGLIFVFVWEAGLSLAIGALATYSVTRIGLSAYAGLVEGAPVLLDDALGVVTPGAGGAAAKMLVLLLAGVYATSALLQRRNLA